MAQDYSINLKATLDTTQVKQQIAQLRNQSQSITQQTGGGRQGQVGAFPSLQALQATLSRLNTTLMQLQTAIRQMATSIRSQTQTLRAQLTPNRAVQPAVNTRNALSPAIASKPPLLRMFKEEYEKTHADWTKKELIKAWDKEKRDFDIKDRIVKATFNKRLGYLIGGQLLGGAGDLATSAGYNTLGTSLNIAGQSVTAGAGTAFAMSQMGLPKAGAIGALVGGATAVASAFSKLKEHTEALGQTIYAITLKNQTLISDFRSSLNANEIAWKSSQKSDFYNELPLDILKRRQNSMYGSYIENLDKRDTLEKYYREQLSKIEANRDAQLKPLYARSTQLASNSDNIIGAGRRILEQHNVAEQIKLIQESANTQLEAVKNSYTNELKNINKSITDYENLLKAIDNVSSKEKERIKLQEQEALRLTELKTAHEAYLKSLNDSISKFKGEFNQAATEQNATIFTQDILANKSMSAKDKFNAISKRLDDAYDSRNTAQLGVYSAVNQLDSFAKSFYMTADVGNLPFASFMRQMAVQKLTKNIADSQLDLANENSIVNIFENALKSITQKLVAPDMSHVTSISQYGYGMGEVDNADQRMENYLSKQTNLQEQINEKLRQGIKTLPLYSD